MFDVYWPFRTTEALWTEGMRPDGTPNRKSLTELIKETRDDLTGNMFLLAEISPAGVKLQASTAAFM